MNNMDYYIWGGKICKIEEEDLDYPLIFVSCGF